MPKLNLCSAGSLLGLQLSDGSYPVGKVDMLHLYPMTFTEFLGGIGDKYGLEYLYDIDTNKRVGDLAHQHLWQRLKQYFITGGLPEAITTFIEHQDSLFTAFQLVREKQDVLIQNYYSDIAKHSGKVNAMHIDRTWRSVPAQLSKSQDSSTSRFKFKGIIPGVNRYSQLINVIDWLKAAELVIGTPVIDTIRQPLSAYARENFFKLMMFDVGALGAMSGLEPKLIYDYDYGSYKGYFAENFVAQQLIATQASGEFYSEVRHSSLKSFKNSSLGVL